MSYGINELLCYEVLCCKNSIRVNEYKRTTYATQYLLAQLSLYHKFVNSGGELSLCHFVENILEMQGMGEKWETD